MKKDIRYVITKDGKFFCMIGRPAQTHWVKELGLAWKYNIQQIAQDIATQVGGIVDTVEVPIA